MLPDQRGGVCCILWRYGYNSKDVKDVLAGKNLGGYRKFIQLSTEA